MKEKIICIVTPQARTYYQAVAVAKEFLDKEQNIINQTGKIPDGQTTEYTVSTATVKHFTDGKLNGPLEVVNLADNSVSFREEYRHGKLIRVQEQTAPAEKPAPRPAPRHKGTTLKTTKGTRSFYSNGNEVAEETIASNGITLELLGNIPDGPVEELDEQDRVVALAHYKNNKLNGELVRYNTEGKIISREQYVDGLLEGPAEYISFTKHNVLTARCNYKNSRLNGERTLTQQGGILRRREFYKNGHLTGPRLSYYPSGEKESEENYADGKLDGKREVFFPSGGIWYRENYLKGRLDGERFCYFTSGKIYLEEFYTDGMLEGRRNTYAQNGELLSSEEYHWGAQVLPSERKTP